MQEVFHRDKHELPILFKLAGFVLKHMEHTLYYLYSNKYKKEKITKKSNLLHCSLLLHYSIKGLKHIFT